MHIGVIGAGQAAATLIRTLFEGSFPGLITLFSDEGVPPYQRPPLSKHAFDQTLGLAEVALLPPACLDDPRLHFVPEIVRAIDPDQGQIHTDARTVQCDHLVLATGTRARPLQVDGREISRALSMRTLADRARLQAALKPRQRVVIVGAGFMAFELAASLSARDGAITVLAQGARALPQLSASMAEALVVRSPASVRTHAKIQDVTEDAVRLEDAELPADLVIATTGSLPNIELLRPLGLAHQQGIAVDATMGTAHPKLSAIGELSLHQDPITGERYRIESVSQANDSATVLARHLLGVPTPVPQAPWFWSDQGDQHLQVAGRARRDDGASVLSATNGSLVVIRHRDDQITAVEALNNAREFMAARRLFDAGSLSLAQVQDAGSLMAHLQASRSTRAAGI